LTDRPVYDAKLTAVQLVRNGIITDLFGPFPRPGIEKENLPKQVFRAAIFNDKKLNEP
jgi:hypothetical protein